MGHEGFEPSPTGLKVPCATITLMTLAGVFFRHTYPKTGHAPTSDRQVPRLGFEPRNPGV